MTWKPTSKTLDSMAAHCDRETRKLMRTGGTGDWREATGTRDPRKLHPHHFHAIMAALVIAMAGVMLSGHLLI